MVLSEEFSVRPPSIHIAVLQAIFNFDLGPPSPGVPGEGPDCHLSKEIGGFGQHPGGLFSCILVLSTARSSVGQAGRPSPFKNNLPCPVPIRIPGGR